MRRWSIAIFVAVFSFYLLTSGREPAWGDAHSMWEVAARIVKDGSIAISTRWPEDLPPGRNGLIYGIAPIGPSLVHVPGAAGVALVNRYAREDLGLLRPLFTHLGPAALGALAAVLFFLLLVELGIGKRVASVSTAILACATTTWVYARMPYSEILQLACFLGLFRQTLRVIDGGTPAMGGGGHTGSAGGAGGNAPRGIDGPSRWTALWWVVWAGCLLNSKYVFALAIAGSAAAIAWSLRKRVKPLIAWAAIGGVPFVLLALLYNYLRWEDVTRTGYEPYLGAYFGGSVFDGAWGMLASPNKSALLYSPPLLLALIGLPAAVRAKPTLGLLLATMVVPTFLVYCTYRSWSGDYAWGPRFFVWAVPVVLVPMAWCFDQRWKRWLLVATVVVGVAVQILGSALYWDHFIRIAIDAKNQWLGQPNRTGAYVPEKGRGHCDSCFEDTYELLWTPAFQPIRGHWWLVKAIARGDDAQSAQDDAPWRRYTDLKVNLAATYPRARIDWWGLLWLKDFKDTRTLGVILLVLMVIGMAFGLWRWLVCVRDVEGRAEPVERSPAELDGR